MILCRRSFGLDADDAADFPAARFTMQKVAIAQVAAGAGGDADVDEGLEAVVEDDAEAGCMGTRDGGVTGFDQVLEGGGRDLGTHGRIGKGVGGRVIVAAEGGKLGADDKEKLLFDGAGAKSEGRAGLDVAERVG